MNTEKAKRSERKNDGGGFTLVEVLLALVLTVMATTLVAQGFSVGGRSAVLSQKRTRAVWLAQAKMTELETGEMAVNRGVEGDFGPEAPLYRYKIESQGDSYGLYTVTVTVSWNDRGVETAYALTRMLYRPAATESETQNP